MSAFVSRTGSAVAIMLCALSPPRAHATAVIPVSLAIASERSLGCLADAIAYEAAFEPLEGQKAVAEVVMNRLRDPRFPKTVCGVVYQGSNRRTGCQFTFTCDGSLRRRMSDRVMTRARTIAQAALDSMLPSQVLGATFYHANYVTPRWAPQLSRVGQIGAHIFYRRPGGALPATPFRQASVPIANNTAQIERSAARPFAPWGLSIAPAGHFAASDKASAGGDPKILR